MERAKGGDTYDLESLVQFGIFPEDLGLCLGEFRMVLVRIDLENLGGHVLVVGYVARRIRVTWKDLCRPSVQCLPRNKNNNNNNSAISVNSASGGMGPGTERMSRNNNDRAIGWLVNVFDGD